ncbi:MAG TPA: hypothetical protein VGU46_00160 [Acidobacteriaceae bacterium]|nr:hypothetical protein [Acidobacteriaceae bacterium]
MRNRVERLRIWLLVSALVLMVVIAAFMGWARYLRGHFLAGLPARLGVNVVREANAFKYCQNAGKRQLYCIKAATASGTRNGKTTLHDVTITLFGKKGDRNDRIYGDEFEYDKVAQVVRATGVVHVDLQSAADAAAAGDGSKKKVVHVTTSGLVYLQKFGVAATNAAIDFEVGGLTGHAVGADYSSDSGVVALHSAVKMSGTMRGEGGGHAVGMTAETAQFDQHSGQVMLTRATYESEGRRVAADEATLDRRVDGTLSRIRAVGNVRVEEKSATMTSARADVALTAESEPERAVLSGGVKYAADGVKRQMHGAADEATIAFDGKRKAQPEHAVFVGSVRMTERTRVGAAAGWSVRDLTAGKVEASLVVGAGGKAEVRDLEAMGSPRLSVVDAAVGAAGAKTTEMAGDDLKAHLVAAADGKSAPRVDTIAGRGHTVLRQVKADGGEQTVSADSLDAKMRPLAVGGVERIKGGVVQGGNGKALGGEELGERLWSSVEQGHVVMVQKVPAKVNAKGVAVGAKVEHAMAERAVYDGDADRMTLTDGVQVSDGESVVWANEIAFDQKTGDARAVGGVKVSYVAAAAGAAKTRGEAGDGEASHVVADRAEFVRASGVATFYGAPARLWQGGSQVRAAVIELSNADRRLVARGDGSARGAQVETVLAGRGSGGGAGASGGAAAGGQRCESAGGEVKAGAERAGGVTRIESGGLRYLGARGEAEFTSGIRAETDEGTIRANEGVAYLRAKGGGVSGNAAGAGAGGSSNAGVAMLSGDLDRVIATGGVELDRVGLKATGTRLVYTASDGSAVLTGDAKTPPRAVEARGTTTGEALRFRAGCGGGGSVEVVGGSGLRVHTDATFEDRRKSERGR